MILKILICAAALIEYATCRTAKDFREMPDPTARLSQADYPSYNIIAPDGPGTYAFGYEIDDIATGNVQFRDEEKLRNGTVRGSYGVLLPDNTLHITRYIADHLGYRSSSETRKKFGNGPLKLELQVQPPLGPKPHPISAQQNVFVNNPSTTSFPDPMETLPPRVDPALANAIYQQHQINLQPSYSPFRDRDILDPQYANAIYQQQFLNPPYGFRQSVISSNPVSTYQIQQTTRPPFFNWFGANNNNNNNYQSDQQQQGPILGFLSNLAQNNPVTNFLNGFNQNEQLQQQQQNPIQNFFSNLNPFNIFNNNNRPQQSIIPSLSDQYVSTMSPPYLNGNLDPSVFSNDHFLNPNQFNSPNQFNNGNPYINSLQSVNYNQGLNKPTPIYNPNFSQGSYSSSTLRPGYSGSNVLPYSQLYRPQNPSAYPVYQNPYQTISPISILSNPNYNKQKKKTGKRKNNKNKVDVETDSDWFNDFLDKRKEASLDVSSRRPAKKDSDEDVGDLEDYFR